MKTLYNHHPSLEPERVLLFNSIVVKVRGAVRLQSVTKRALRFVATLHENSHLRRVDR